jgi:hypothetical protein
LRYVLEMLLCGKARLWPACAAYVKWEAQFAHVNHITLSQDGIIPSVSGPVCACVKRKMHLELKLTRVLYLKNSNKIFKVSKISKIYIFI